MESTFDKDFWNNRWVTGETGWDLGEVSPALKAYIDQLNNKDLRILIPGCGNSYEAEYLWQQGFRNTCVVDISPEAIRSFRKRVPLFPEANIFCADFFTLGGNYDLILEQTFFCALIPSVRNAYVKKMHELLVPGGKLAGLLFLETGNTDKPPFQGSVEEYRALFSPLFNLKTLEPAYNSIPPRAGREVFIIFQNKD